jgi:hypothetical protein
VRSPLGYGGANVKTKKMATSSKSPFSARNPKVRESPEKSGEVGQISRTGQCTAKYGELRNCLGEKGPLSRGRSVKFSDFPNPQKSTEIHTKPGEVRPIPERKTVKWRIGATRKNTKKYKEHTATRFARHDKQPNQRKGLEAIRIVIKIYIGT